MADADSKPEDRELSESQQRIERLEQENHRLRSQLPQGRETNQTNLELALLKEVSSAIVSELDLQRVLELVVRKARELIDAETVLVPRISEDCQEYHYVAAAGKNAEAIINTRFPIRTGMCGWVLTHESPLLYGEDFPFALDESTHWEKGQTSALLVPLFGKTQIIGGLSALGKNGGGSFTQKDMDLITLFANQVSIAIENASLVQELQKTLDSLEQRVEERTAELSDINRELEFFCHSASHDLRSPLRGIDGYSHILLEDYRDVLDESAKRYLRRIRAGGQQMGEIIDALLHLSKVVRKPLKHERINLSAMVDSIVRDYRADAPEREISVEIAPGLKCHGDPDLIRIALNNLIGNAWKYTNKCKRPVIEFGSKMEGGYTVFSVRDNGCGFDMEFKHKLFEPFQRLQTEGDYEGTGVGLAIVQRIFNRHGGHVCATSEPGRGATFSFSLPQGDSRRIRGVIPDSTS